MTIRFGVLSTARIGEDCVIPAIHASKKAKLGAVASRHLDSAAAFAERNQIPKFYGSYEELLNDEEIDAVYIPLPNHLHAQWTIAAAKAGKHVLCEKPAALNAKQMEQMAEICREHHVLFMEAFMYQFHPQWKRVEEILSSGKMGEIRIVNASFSFHLDNPSDIRMISDFGGGALYDIGCYCIHATRSIVGKSVASHSQASGRFKNDVDTTLSAVLEFPNGVIANLDCSFDVQPRQYIEIVGSQGTVKLSHPFRPDTGQATLELIHQEGQQIEHFNPFDIYLAEIDHFSDCIMHAKTPKNSIQDSMENMKMIDEIYAVVRKTNV